MLRAVKSVQAAVGTIDVVVIGSGPAGQRAATYLAEHNRRVAIVGPLFSMGSIQLDLSTGAALPYFTFREAVMHLSGQRQTAFYKDSDLARPRIPLSRKAIQERIERVAVWANETAVARLRAAGVQIVHGKASFLDKNTLAVLNPEVSNQPILLKAEQYIIATGSRNIDDENIPYDGRRIINCDRLLQTLGWQIPKKPVIIGATTQGVEYASTLASLTNVQTTIIDSKTEILPAVDDEMREMLKRELQNKGTTFRLGDRVATVAVNQQAETVCVTFNGGEQICGDLVIFARNKFGNTQGLNLEAILGPGALDDRGYIIVNENMQSRQPHIYAVGNVIAHTGISYLSSQQGMEAAMHIVGECEKVRAFDTNLIPHTLNTIPLVSRVGPNERSLRESGREFVSGYADFNELAKGQMLQRKGVLKLNVCPRTRELLAVHAIGTSATELVHIGQAVMSNKGTVNALINSVWNYPSFAEAYRVAAFSALAKCLKT